MDRNLSVPAAGAGSYYYCDGLIIIQIGARIRLRGGEPGMQVIVDVETDIGISVLTVTSTRI